MEDLQKILEAKGLKNTRQRKLVFSVLKAAEGPLSAEEIYIQLQGEKINLSTVYRILEIFLQKEIVLKTNISDQKSTYEINHSEHRHYLICIKCKKVTPISGCPLRAYETYLTQKNQYIILEHKLEIMGICPDCQNK